jgi:hypothetical protein
MSDEKKQIQPKQSERRGVEGEGSYTATHNYNDGLRESVKKGDAEKLGREAEKALSGAEGKELRNAEKAAKSGTSLKSKK